MPKIKIWKSSRWDALHLLLSVGQVAFMLFAAYSFDEWESAARIGSAIVLLVAMTYNIVIVSHLFTHSKWFISPALNILASALNSINAAQSIKEYELSHVRNHHRYNNDPWRGNAKPPNDLSSTFMNGKYGAHEGVLRYCIIGALRSLLTQSVKMLISVFPSNNVAFALDRELQFSRSEHKFNAERRTIRLDRLTRLAFMIILLSISPTWAFTCLIPISILSYGLVNLQNYYEHVDAANPLDRFSDSVSYYGRVYNRLTFNDGYHQEHHLSPSTHWLQLPNVRKRHFGAGKDKKRTIGRVPAMLGFLGRATFKSQGPSATTVQG